MKVSAFGPPEHLPLSAEGNLTARRWPAAMLAFFYLIAHLAFLAPSLEDIDSINFALGLRHFDPALHQPHPPGYPVFIALGRVSLALINAAAPSMSPVHA